ncbi:MAG: metallophosphoesterase, partial [Deinococcota bacterium]|nr:metallophosphoesterase [Deinococcota bacterium]
MFKLIAIGDVHGQWDELWRALRAALAADDGLQPTPQLIAGRFQVVLSGDLVHYKDALAYALAAGVGRYDCQNPDHLRRAAEAQILELYRFRRYAESARGNVSVILGNHDETALEHGYSLSSRGGLRHDEFDEARGGLALPEDLAAWLRAFPREKVYHGVHVAHAGPLPAMQRYDDFFYHDDEAKTWWRKKPEYLSYAGHRFGVYGHTVMPGGVYLDEAHRFAMIDALGDRQFLEMILSAERLDY